MDCKAFNRLFKTIWCNCPTSEKVHEYTNINVNDFPGVGRVISKKLDRHAQFQGQIGRGAASRDALLEDSNYYAKANEWGERSSIAQTKGSMKAYGGDVDKMAETVEADSQIKAFQQLKNINEAKKQKLLDDDGNLEDLGKTAYAIPIAENVAKVATKAKVLSNEQTRNDLISQLEEGITMNLTGSQREGESAEGHQLRLETNRNKAKESVAATGLSDAKNGEDVASAIAAMGAMNYASYGATIGSFVPVVGTAVGGFVGGAVGFAKDVYDVYDGDVKAAWNWATGNKPATSSNIASPSGNPFLGNIAQAYVSNHGATSSNNLEELRSVIIKIVLNIKF